MEKQRRKEHKKGFDIVYCDLTNNSIWYSEVKSGHRVEADECKVTHITLLKRAYSDLKEKFTPKPTIRDSLWESALIDIDLVFPDSKSISLKKLLSADSPLSAPFKQREKNVITIAVVYNDAEDYITVNDLEDFASDIENDAFFKAGLIFSIQKKTFQKIADFLRQEVIA